MSQKTTQYVIEVAFDDEQISELEADIVFRERLRDALTGVFAMHIGRVQ